MQANLIQLRPEEKQEYYTNTTLISNLVDRIEDAQVILYGVVDNCKDAESKSLCEGAIYIIQQAVCSIRANLD